MAYPPEIKTEAYQLYLLGNSPAEIAAELKRRHPAADMPGAKTLEKWAYVPVGGKTWSERRYEAEAAAQDAVTRDVVTAKTKLLEGMLRLQAKLQERALEAAEDAEAGNFSQEVYAYVNATKTTARMLDSRLAEDTRAKDAIDALFEALRRTVPGFDTLEPRVKVEFDRIVNTRG